MSFMKWFWFWCALLFSPFQVSALNCHNCKPGEKCSSIPCSAGVCITVTAKGNVARSCFLKSVVEKLGVEIGGKCKEITQDQFMSVIMPQSTDTGGLLPAGAGNQAAGGDQLKAAAEAMGMTPEEILALQEKVAKGEMTPQQLQQFMQEKMVEAMAKQFGRMGNERAADSITMCACDKTDCNSKDKDGTSSSKDKAKDGSGTLLRSISEFVFGIAIFSSVSVGWILLRL